MLYANILGERKLTVKIIDEWYMWTWALDSKNIIKIIRQSKIYISIKYNADVIFLSPKIFAYSINHIFLIFRTFRLKMRNILPFEEMYIFRFMVFTTTIIFQLYLGNQFYWWRKPEYLEKTTNLLTTLEMIGTDCIVWTWALDSKNIIKIIWQSKIYISIKYNADVIIERFLFFWKWR
jgi:hypothetical protein